MHRASGRPRRLRVSSLAAVANPSYTRIDTWNLLDDACRHLVAVHRAGLDTRQKVAHARRLIDRLAAYERYWLYPGAANLEAFRGYLADLATERLADEVSLAVRLLSEYAPRCSTRLQLDV
jgi:arginine decarboxylase